MGCVVDKRKPIITNRCSHRTTMMTGVEGNLQGTCKTKGKKWLTASTVKNALGNDREGDDGARNHNGSNSMKLSNGDSECNCVIHEAPNTMDSFKDKLMTVINELEKGEKLRKERGGYYGGMNWEDSNTNTVSNTRMNSEREGYGNKKKKK